MADYKNTLNLPQTEFPMKANLSQREPGILAYWYDIDLYGKLRKLREGKRKFILHDGPPYANGDIHLGHALNKVLKDIVVKSQSMNGYDAPFIPGWDCHGLPIELNVEKKFGKVGEKISVDDFRAACREYALTQVDRQREGFKRLGIFADWGHPYLTMHYNYEADIVRSLAKIIQNGHVQRGFKPVHWCVDCGSALAEAEVEYQDKKSHAIDIRFKVLNENDFLERCHKAPHDGGEGEVYVPIWTTTPWTIPANQAIALNPEFTYVLVQCKTEQGAQRFLIAEKLLSDVMMRYGIDDYQVVASCLGKDLEQVKCQHPFYDRAVPIVIASHVTADAGTGAVHTAPGHGLDDYMVGIQYSLPIDNPVGDDGCFVKGTPLFAGEHVFSANDHVIEVLTEKGALVHHEMITHSYPVCWRHKTPLIFRATPQWFINMEQSNLREESLAEITEAKWLPSWGEARIADMIIKRPDWCISRQRAWGVPLSLFIHKTTGKLHPRIVELMEEVAKRIEKGGIEIWDKLDPREILGKDAEKYEKTTDVLDVWFDSGVSHTCVLKHYPGLQFPADLYLEGSDQYRGWFQSSMISSCAMYNKTPYKQVITHGFTVDEKGHKMSKSLGNVIAPDKVMKTLGADILRLWVASTDYRGEVALSDEILKRTTDAYRRIRNTARFLLSNIHDFDTKKHLMKFEDMLALDQWAVDRARLLQEEIKNNYDEYQFHAIHQKIHHFCSIDLGSFYLDIIKDRQYTTHKDSIARRSAQTAMYHIIEALVRWIAPILSFTADEIWKLIPGERSESVFFETWYQGLPALPKEERMNQDFWERIMVVRDEVNKEIERLRNNDVLGSALESEVTIYADVTHKPLLDLLGDELRFVLITSGADVKVFEDASADAIETELKGLKIKVGVSKHPKCIRCWHRRADVGQNPDHPEICGRCVSNISGSGETRNFA